MVQREIFITADLIARDRRDSWPNLFDAPDQIRRFATGTTMYDISPLDQVRLWQGPFIGALWNYGEGPRPWTCPEALRDPPAGFSIEGMQDSPATGGMASYYYSAALFTDPALWAPAATAARAAPKPFARRVGVHEVWFPSSKVVFCETAAFHGNSRACYEPDSSALNIVCADGHGRAIRPADARPGLPYTYLHSPSFDFLAWPTGKPVPFCASAGGANGVDF